MDNRTEQDQDQDTTGLVSVQAAAEALGVTVEAVRKRLQRRQLSGVRRGGRWFVDLAGAQVDTGQDEQRTRTRQDRQSSPDVRDMVTHLREENARLWERLQRADEERAELRRMLNLEQQTVRALSQARSAPALPAATQSQEPARLWPVGVPDQTPPQQAAQAREKRPWYKRWFGL